MLLNIIGTLVAFGFGYLFFWLIAWRLKKPLGRSGPSLDKKYLGFRSYDEMRSYIIGAQFLWGPIIGVGGVFLMVSLGWPESIGILVFLSGYALAGWHFWRKPKSAWDDSDLPV